MKASHFRHLDFINIMSYDLGGAWDPYTAHNSPFCPNSTETGDRAYWNVVC